MAALLEGQSIRQIAERFNLSKSVVQNWRGGLTLEQKAQVQSQKRDFGELLAGYLAANLAALQVQAEQFADRAWLAKQDASEAAVLHGVMVDKAVRLLEAAEPSPEPGDDEP